MNIKKEYQKPELSVLEALKDAFCANVSISGVLQDPNGGLYDNYLSEDDDL